MMSALAEKLQSVFKMMRGYGKITEANVADALKQVRMALLAADVNYQVARDFCERVKTRALGAEVAQSIRPGDLFVKIVHDELLATFQQGSSDLNETRPLRILLCGLNGAGKTTSAGKLALFLRKNHEQVTLVAADLARPAAIQQLQTLGKQIEVPVIAPEGGEKILDYLRRVVKETSSTEGRTITIFDTAGRLEVNAELLDELKSVVEIVQPQETLLVADAATGQSAAEVAKSFLAAAPLTGIILSKFDGDTRGGAALTLQSLTNCPIKFLGNGEQLPALERFDAERLVGRLLGMGDIIGLVEKAQQEISMQDAEKMTEKLRSNSFTLQDFLDQMKMIRKLGPLQNLLGMIPGMNKLPSSAFDERALKQTEAIILSMTPVERQKPDMINGKRRQRISRGSGTTVAQVNDLLHRFQEMRKLMAKLTRGGNSERMLKNLLGRMGT